jgi:hypothetical protein
LVVNRQGPGSGPGAARVDRQAATGGGTSMGGLHGKK